MSRLPWTHLSFRAGARCSPYVNALAAAFVGISMACGAPDPQAAGPTENVPRVDESPSTPEVATHADATTSDVIVDIPLVLGQAQKLDEWQGGERRRLSFEVPAGHYVSGRVTQGGIDVELEIRDPDGKALLWVDTPVGASGAETFHAITTQKGRHVMEVHAFGKGPLSGSVTVLWHELRVASDLEHALVDAARLTAEAERLRSGLLRQPELKEKALDTYERAAEQWHLAQRPGQVGRMLMEMGAIRWRYFREIEAADRLLAQAQPLLAETDDSYRARLRHYRGELAVAHGRPEDARDHYAAAVDTWPAAQSTNLAGTLNNLGFIEHRLGRPQRAIERYHQALKLWRTKGMASQEARTAHNLAKLYIWVGDGERARSLLSQAAEIRQRLEDLPRLASTWAALGQVEVAEDRFDAAETWLHKAGDIHRSSGNERLEAYTLMDLAEVARRAQRLEEAEQLLRRALPKLQRAEDHRQVGRIFVHLARLHLARGEVQEAIGLAASAREHLESTKDPLDLAGVHGLTAETLRADGHAEQAVPFVRRAVEAVEGIRRRPTNRIHRASFLSRVISVYETAIEVELARAGDQRWARALEWAERSKGRSFLDELVDRPSPGDGGVEGSFELMEPSDYGSLQSLTRDRILLLYFLGDRNSYLWRLDITGLRVWTLPPRRDLEEGARQLFKVFSERPRLELRARRQQIWARWSEVLLPDDLLTDLPDVGSAEATQLQIVADGALYYLPFAALLGTTDGSQERRPLVESFEISYAPSLSTLQHLEARDLQRRSDTDGTIETEGLLVVADPVYAVDPRCPSDNTTEPGSSPEPQYRRLNASAEEASWLQAQFPGTQVLSGFDARLDNLQALGLERYQRIHFAVHGELDTSSGRRPRLVLAQRDRNCNRAPSFLDMADIFQWRLRSELAVLGACRSGLGRDLRGEGLIGMTRAFLQAGSSQVMVSLWDVDDQAASRWTTHFYTALASGDPGPSALRQAQLRLREETGTRDVFYWAPFVLFGTAGTSDTH